MKDAKDWIAFGSLLITIISLLITQWKSNKLQKESIHTANKSERRTEIKLRVYQILLSNERLSLALIADRYHNAYPSDTISNQEMHKSIYEMLVDDTIVAYPDKSFSANSIDGGDDEEQDEDKV